MENIDTIKGIPLVFRFIFIGGKILSTPQGKIRKE